MPLYKRPGSPFWWISLRHRGRRLRRSTETSDRATAQRQHDELKARLWTEKVSGYVLADALLAWLDERPRSRKDLNAVALIRREYPDRPLIDVTPASVEAELGKDRGPGAYNRHMVIIRAALNIAARKVSG
jgi:superfamily I DNA and/or RNA helicase